VVLTLRRVSCSDQILLEMDANVLPTVLLSSWDYFLLFHRTSATRILVSKIVPRDRISPDLAGPTGPYPTIERDWTPLMLTFALLLLAAAPDKLAGFVQPNRTHLTTLQEPSTPSSTTKRKRKRESPTQTGAQSGSESSTVGLPAVMDTQVFVRVLPPSSLPSPR